MILCPDCRDTFEFSLGYCDKCHWTLDSDDGINVLLSNSDKKSAMFSSYKDNYDRIGNDDLAERIQPEIYLKNQAKKLFSYCDNIKDKDVCEVGVGSGGLVQHLATAGCRSVLGIDICMSYLERLKKRYQGKDNIEFTMANAENLPFYNQFDTIVASDVLEHVLNVGNFLFGVNHALRTGGKFVVRVPLNEDINVYSKFCDCQYDYVHLRNFNKQTLNTLLKSVGFKIQKINYDGYLLYNTREYLKKYDKIYTYYEKKLRSYYKKDCSESAINNTIGRLLMKPFEMIAVCVKEKEACWKDGAIRLLDKNEATL